MAYVCVGVSVVLYVCVCVCVCALRGVWRQHGTVWYERAEGCVRARVCVSAEVCCVGIACGTLWAPDQ